MKCQNNLALVMNHNNKVFLQFDIYILQLHVLCNNIAFSEKRILKRYLTKHGHDSNPWSSDWRLFMGLFLEMASLGVINVYCRVEYLWAILHWNTNALSLFKISKTTSNIQCFRKESLLCLSLFMTSAAVSHATQRGQPCCTKSGDVWPRKRSQLKLW